MTGGEVDFVRRLARLAARDWWFLGIAAKELGCARIRHLVRPTGEILLELQARQTSAAALTPAQVADVTRLGWAIGAVSNRVPWRADCLLRVMAADRWLRRWQLQPEFYLGVTKDAGGVFGAHAWLSCGGLDVTGGEAGAFTPLIAPTPRGAPG